MTYPAVPARVHSLRPQSPVLAPISESTVHGSSQSATARQVAERERHRLAGELHGGPVQEVLAAGLAIDVCLADLPAESPVRPSLERARRLTATALRQLRSTLQALREGMDAPDEELPDLLRRLAAGQPADHLEVSVDVTGQPVPLAAAARRSLFRIASECVFNAAVHGDARRVAVRLSYGRWVLGLCVADDGQGNPATLTKIIRGEVPGTGGGYHLGLADIAARADEMGWTLRADRSDLGGIALHVVVPAPAPADMPGESDG
ncbi:MAG: hypothetical protein JO132_10095 [Streptosporangiaceae bacterium]|nr:hypothetical protein [Streptosporangiaceae bacterium]